MQPVLSSRFAEGLSVVMGGFLAQVSGGVGPLPITGTRRVDEEVLASQSAKQSNKAQPKQGSTSTLPSPPRHHKRGKAASQQVAALDAAAGGSRFPKGLPGRASELGRWAAFILRSRVEAREGFDRTEREAKAAQSSQRKAALSTLPSPPRHHKRSKAAAQPSTAPDANAAGSVVGLRQGLPVVMGPLLGAGEILCCLSRGLSHKVSLA